MVVQGIDHVVQRALAEQRSHGIVEDQVHVFVGISLYGRERRVVTLLSSLENLLHLAPFVAQHDVLKVGNEHGVRHDGNLVYPAVALEHVDGVLHHHLARHLEKLLRCGHAET